ncbi:MAG: ATP-dependent helicase DeaD [Thermoleophilaceae bacterium]|nr:ATP-dependent helicase DeaD [Thermoleophilaceae bacterium]
MATFKELGLSEPLVEALTGLGYTDPTPIQEQAIPALLAGRDVIGQAQTGTGKTAAFGLPLLDYIDPSSQDVEALVLTPTRELCIQVTQALRGYGEKRGIDVVAVFGGAPIRDQMTRLRRGGGQVVVGTVGRVLDLMSRHALVLTSTRFVVLDEADEMLDLGFLEDVETILSRTPSGRQTALFSATMPPPIHALADKFMYDPEVIKVRAATLTIDTVDQYYVEVGSDKEKPAALARVLKSERPDQAIIFTRTKIGADRLSRALGDQGLRVKTLHGDMSQGARDGVMISFKEGRERLLVATDIAARGLDISGVSHVINYDLPNSPEVYVHRIGRTGRVGREGTAITLSTPKQAKDLDAIRKHANTEIEPWSEDHRSGVSQPRKPVKADTAAPAEAAAPEAPAAAEAPEPVAEAETAGQAEVTPAAAAEPDKPRRRTRRIGGGPREVRRQQAAATNGDGAEPKEPATAVADAPEPSRAVANAAERREARRPRHTKPRRERGETVKLIVGAGRSHGLEPKDVVGAIVEGSHLEGEDIHNVRLLERYSFVEVPAARAQEVVDKVNGSDVRGVELRLEVAGRK